MIDNKKQSFLSRLSGDKKGQFIPQRTSMFSSLEDHPVILIVIFAIIIGAALWSIQYVTCQPGWFGGCLKVLCFWGVGLC